MKTELNFVRTFQELWFFPGWRTPQAHEHAKRPKNTPAELRMQDKN